MTSISHESNRLDSSTAAVPRTADENFRVLLAWLEQMCALYPDFKPSTKLPVVKRFIL